MTIVSPAIRSASARRISARVSPRAAAAVPVHIARAAYTTYPTTTFQPRPALTNPASADTTPRFPPLARRHLHASPANMVHVIENMDAYKTAISKDKLVVIDCFATWCGPCKLIAPKVVKFSEAYPDVDFYKLDVDEVSDVAAELAVRAMPTFVFFKNGERIHEVVGANAPALETAIKEKK